jgi:hypothetical protein
MRVGRPAEHAVVEPLHFGLALWEAATELLLQLVRVDAVVAAKRCASVLYLHFV